MAPTPIAPKHTYNEQALRRTPCRTLPMRLCAHKCQLLLACHPRPAASDAPDSVSNVWLLLFPAQYIPHPSQPCLCRWFGARSLRLCLYPFGMDQITRVFFCTLLFSNHRAIVLLECVGVFVCIRVYYVWLGSFRPNKHTHSNPLHDGVDKSFPIFLFLIFFVYSICSRPCLIYSVG